MAFLLSLFKGHDPFPESPLVGNSLSLAARTCDPHVCSSSRVAIDKRAVGGSLQCLGSPEGTKPTRFNRGLSIPFRKYSLTASAWEDDSGEGSVLLETNSSARRKKHSSSRHFRLTRGGSGNDDALFVQPSASLNYNRAIPLSAPIASQPDGNSEKWTPEMANTIDAHRVNVSGKSSSSRPTRRLRVELRRDTKAGSFSFEKRGKHGKLYIHFTPNKRVAASMTLKEPVRTVKRYRHPQLREIHRFLRRRRRDAGKRRSSGAVVVKSDLEYRWNEKSFVASKTIEAFRGTLSLRTRTNPLRFTPRLQVPIGSGSKDRPWISWARAPRSGLGEIQLGRKGLELSADWSNPRVSLKQKSPDGSSARLTVNSEGTFSVDKTLVSDPLFFGAVVTLNVHMSNKSGSSLTTTAMGPFGVISMSAATSHSFNLVADVNTDNGDRAYTLNVKVEGAKGLAARFGIFF